MILIHLFSQSDITIITTYIFIWIYVSLIKHYVIQLPRMGWGSKAPAAKGNQGDLNNGAVLLETRYQSRCYPPR